MIARVLLVCLTAMVYGSPSPGINTSMMENEMIANPILGGVHVFIDQYPHQLYMSVGCGAAIISKSWALTAAHCCVKEKNGEVRALLPREVTLRTGSSYRLTGGKVHNVVQVKIHRNYSHDTSDNDICLLKVFKPFVFDRKTQAIALASTNASEYSPNRTTIVSGWGATEFEGEATEYMLAVELPLMTNQQCKKAYRNLPEESHITDNQFCAYKQEEDSCQGDSGGALIANNTLLGVVSWGTQCGEYPGVYTRVGLYRNWILGIAGV